MSNIGKGNIGFPILDEDYNTPHNSIPTTDDIASRYKKRIMQGISAKILKFNKTLIPPTFTQEEMAYIKKDAEDNDPTSEVKVITPDPTITLKKGNTEINIKNAAALVRKMEEIYPNPNKSIMFNSDSSEFSVPSPAIPPQPDIKTVNKNAYEIRESIIEKSIDIVKYSLAGNSCDIDTMVNRVLDVASKLYRFVENRR